MCGQVQAGRLCDLSPSFRGFVGTLKQDRISKSQKRNVTTGCHQGGPHKSGQRNIAIGRKEEQSAFFYTVPHNFDCIKVNSIG